MKPETRKASTEAAEKKAAPQKKKTSPKKAEAEKPAAKWKTAASPAAPEVMAQAPPPAGGPPAPAQVLTQDKAVERYWEAVGRRKTAVARVRLFTRGEKTLAVNGKTIAEYFPHPSLQKIASEAIDVMKSTDRFRASAHVKGGGLHAQAEAIRHGTARALVLFNPDFRKRLKRAGYLTRDPRMKERKKFGLKGARRAPQWAKR